MARMSSRGWRLGILIGCAVVVPLVIAFLNGRITIGDPEMYRGDARTYHANAVSITAGKSFDAATSVQRKPPMYSLFIAVGYGLFGERSLSTWLLQALLHIATVVLLYAVALRFFNQRNAWIATMVYACFWGSAFWVYKIGPETLATFFIVLLVYLATTQWNKAIFFYATAFAVTASALVLTKPVVLFALPFLLYFFIRQQSQQRVAQSVVIVGVMVVIIGGWMVRNIVRYDHYEIEQSGQIIWSRSMLASEPMSRIAAYGVAALLGDYITDSIIAGYASQPVPTTINNKMKAFSRARQSEGVNGGALDAVFREEGMPRLRSNIGGFLISSVPSVFELNGPVTHQGKSITHFLADNNVKIENSHFVKALRRGTGFSGEISHTLKIAVTVAIRSIWLLLMGLVCYGMIRAVYISGVWLSVSFLVVFFNVMHALIVIPIEVRFVAPVWPLYVLLGVLGATEVSARWSQKTYGSPRV